MQPTDLQKIALRLGNLAPGCSLLPLTQRNRVIAEMLAQQALCQRDQRLARLGQHELSPIPGPLKLEAGGLRGDPYLAHRRVRRYDELARSILEQNVHHAIVVLELEAGPLVLGRDDGLFQCLKGLVGLTTELRFIQHLSSVKER